MEGLKQPPYAERVNCSIPHPDFWPKIAFCLAIELIHLSFQIMPEVVAVLEDLGRPFLEGSFPAGDHSGVKPKAGRQLGNGHLI